MSFSNWVHNAAIRGCLIAALLSPSPLLAQEKDAEKQPSAPPAEQTKQRTAPPLSVTITGPVSLEREKTVEPNWNAPKCGGTQSHDEADLCEQRRMADAAEWTMYWTGSGVVIGFVGTIFLVLNLYFVRRSTDAAIETVRVMRNAERPYLTPFEPQLRNWEEVILEPDESTVLEVHFDIENLGRGVGFIESYGITHEICRDEQQGGKPLSIRDKIGRMPVSPGGRWKSDAAFDVFQIPAADRLAMMEFKSTLYIYGYIRYFDLFDVFRRTGFMFEFIPNEFFSEKGVFAVCPHSYWYDVEEKDQNKPKNTAGNFGAFAT